LDVACGEPRSGGRFRVRLIALAFVLAWVLVLSGSGRASANTFSFGPPVSTPLGAQSSAVAVGRVNTDPDDHREMVVAADGSSVSVMLAGPTGALGSPTTYSVSGVPDALAIGDVNGDGHNDIVVGSTNATTVSVLRGHGDGTFDTTPVTSPAPYTTNVTFLALGDIDGDGKLDLVTADGYPPGADPARISTFHGNGDGTFSHIADYGVGNTYQSANIVRLADFNGDRKMDIAAASTGCGYGGSQVTVLQNDGTGHFPTQSVLAGDSCIFGMTVADINGDGNPDIVTTNHAGVFDNTSTINVALGNGIGTFQPLKSSATPAEAGAITIAAFNGNGTLDAAVASGSGDVAAGSSGHCPEIAVLAGKSDGTFNTAETFPLTNDPGQVTYGNLSGNGSPPDVVTDDDSEITVLPNGGTDSSGCGVGGGGVPTISSVTPNQGPADGGTTVTVTGANFANGDELCVSSSSPPVWSSEGCDPSTTVASPTEMTASIPPAPPDSNNLVYLGIERPTNAVFGSAYQAYGSSVTYTYTATSCNGTGGGTGGGDSPLTSQSAAAPNLVPTQGAVKGEIAEFWDPDPAATPSTYRVDVCWGDGATSQGAAARLRATNVWIVSAQHTFAADGTYFASVKITDLGSSHEPGGFVLVIPIEFDVNKPPPPPPAFTGPQQSRLGSIANYLQDQADHMFLGADGCHIAAAGSALTGVGLAGPAETAETCGLALDFLGDLTWLGGGVLHLVAGDPPDPNFQVIAKPPRLRAPRLRAHGKLTRSVAPAANAVFANQTTELALYQALLHAIERAEGAAAAHQTRWIKRQASAAADFARQLAASIDTEASDRLALFKAWRASDLPGVHMTASFLRRFEQQLRRHGLPNALRRRFLSLPTASPSKLRAFTASLKHMKPSGALQTYPQALASSALIASLHREATIFRAFAARARGR
jgi:hypothetical protein